MNLTFSIMLCDFVELSKSKHGRIIKCTKCDDKVALLFNNITQAFVLDEFYKLKNFLDSLKVKKFFSDYPCEEKLHVRTEQKNLYFSFSECEIYELRSLMEDAHLKLTIYDAIKKNIN